MAVELDSAETDSAMALSDMASLSDSDWQAVNKHVLNNRLMDKLCAKDRLGSRP
jgi:hypothetical protein